MKKNILVPALLAIAAWIFLPACGSNTDNNPALQAPETPQVAAPKGTETAPATMPADTTAPGENPAGNKGKDSDDDDDDDRK
jgi:hypothetical protein